MKLSIDTGKSDIESFTKQVGLYPGKNLGKYSFRNAEVNRSISSDIGIL